MIGEINVDFDDRKMKKLRIGDENLDVDGPGLLVDSTFITVDVIVIVRHGRESRLFLIVVMRGQVKEAIVSIICRTGWYNEDVFKIENNEDHIENVIFRKGDVPVIFHN